MTLLPLALVLMAASAVFAGSEAALFSLGDRSRGLPRSVVALRADRVGALSTILLLNLGVNLAFFATLHVMVAPLPGRWAMAANAAGVLVLLLLGEILPKVLGNRHPEVFARAFLPPVALVHRVLAPLVRPLARRAYAGARPTAPLDPERMEALVRGEGDLGLDRAERDLLRHVLELGKLRAGALRVPLARLPRARDDEDLERALARLRRSGRPFAVVVDRDGEVLGALEAAATGGRGRRVREAMRPVPVLPEVAPALNGVTPLLDSGAPFVLLVDEYGHGSGVVPRGRWADTLLDRLDGAGAPLVRGGRDDRWRLDPTLPLHDFADRFGEPEGEVDVRVETLGGLVNARLDRVAREGDVLELATDRGRYRLTVAAADETGPRLLDLERIGPAPDGGEAS